MNKEVKINFTHNEFGEQNVESAWATRHGSFYKLDNILFYAKNYSWGDIFSVEERDGELYAHELIEESGHSTVRLLFSKVKEVAKTRKELVKIGCSSELSNLSNLISIDIPSDISYAKILDYLVKGEKKGLWEYQEACISTLHNSQL